MRRSENHSNNNHSNLFNSSWQRIGHFAPCLLFDLVDEVPVSYTIMASDSESEEDLSSATSSLEDDEDVSRKYNKKTVVWIQFTYYYFFSMLLASHTD